MVNVRRRPHGRQLWRGQGAAVGAQGGGSERRGARAVGRSVVERRARREGRGGRRVHSRWMADGSRERVDRASGRNCAARALASCEWKDGSLSLAKRTRARAMTTTRVVCVPNGRATERCCRERAAVAGVVALASFHRRILRHPRVSPPASPPLPVAARRCSRRPLAPRRSFSCVSRRSTARSRPRPRPRPKPARRTSCVGTRTRDATSDASWRRRSNNTHRHFLLHRLSRDGGSTATPYSPPKLSCARITE